jgi:hypothetical protein
MTKEGETP